MCSPDECFIAAQNLNNLLGIMRAMRVAVKAKATSFATAFSTLYSIPHRIPELLGPLENFYQFNKFY